jgi:hypothetical protein
MARTHFADTQVSKSNPAIARIIKATVGEWRGRKVAVEQVDPAKWEFSLYNDTGEPKIYAMHAPDAAHDIPRPSYGAPARKIYVGPNLNGRPGGLFAVVIKSMGHTGAISIVVPTLDQGVLDIARDALQARDKKTTKAVLEQLGPYAGIGGAIVESQAKTFAAVESGKTSRQLTREIDQFLESRKG